MKRFLMCLALLAPTLPVLADYLPTDVQRFVYRREGCDHMRGEVSDGFAGPRMESIGREIDRSCKGTDKELLQLKRKYAANSTIMQLLNQFETGIEAFEAAVPAPAPSQQGKTPDKIGKRTLSRK
jgi:hypothetical protein